MIPILLSLQGIYSYQETQVIHFEPLTKAGLFGIFGKVGSGKSSIVEAITFVLYGATHRMNTGMAYNLTNLRSKTMSIDYEFRIGAQRYRFTAEGKRNSKNFADVKIKRAAYSWSDEINDWLPMELIAEKILGLKYEDFRRAVIVPQGNFQEFLELKGAERNEMMQALFGLEKFDLSAKIKTLKDANAIDINTVNTKLAELGELSVASLELLETNLQTLQNNIETKQKKLTSNREKATIFQQLKLAIETALAKKNKAQLLENQLLEFDNRKIALHRFNTIFTYVNPAIISLEEAEKERHETAFLLLQAEQNLVMTRQRLSEKQAEETHLKADYLQRDILKLQAEDFKQLAKVSAIEVQTKSVQARFDKGKKACETKNEAILNHRNERVLATQKLEQLRAKNIDIQVVNEVLAWHKEKESLQARREKIVQEANDVLPREKALLLQKITLKSSYIVDIQEDTNFETIEHQFDAAFAKIKNERSIVEHRNIILVQQQALQQHAHTLQEGEPCPLCGATHHPKALSNDEDLALKIKENDAQKKHFNTAETALLKQKELLIKLIAASQVIDNEKVKLRTAFQEREDEIKQHDLTYTWAAFSKEDKNAAQQTAAEYSSWQKEKEQLEKQITKYQQDIEKAEMDLKDYEKELKSIENNLQELNVTKNTILQNLKSLQASEFEGFEEQELLQKASIAEKKYREISLAYEQLQQALQVANNAATEANANVTNLTAFLAKAQLRNAQAANILQKALQNMDNITASEAKAILAKAIDIDKETALIQDFFDKLNIARHEANSAAESVKNKEYDSIAHETIVLETKDLETEILNETKQIGSLNAQIAKTKANLERQKAMFVERDVLQLRAENIATLDALFRSKGFVNYVSRVYLQNLVAIANERFKRMTQRQLELQLAEDNAFEVLDVLNDGRTRSVKTLSGGQKFQASLCLALALADSISSAHRENFFFLDEGFGSLDKTSLQVVFETLQSLRKENRVVGIISHVEEMQQEIERYIHVTKDDNKGSLVTVL